MIDKTMFAARLQVALEEQGLTYEEAARRMREYLPPNARLSGVSVWQYANAKAFPRQRSYLDAISCVFGFEPYEFITFNASRADEKRSVSNPQDGQVHVDDLGQGRAKLCIAAEVTWPVALRVLSYLKD